MNRYFAALALTIVSATSPYAATVTAFTGGDAAFSTACGAGGGGSQGCEQAVGELRGGDAGRTATYEASINTPSTFGAAQGQFAWGNGTTEAFTFSHDGSGLLTLSVGAAPLTISLSPGSAGYSGLSNTNSLFIRTRSVSATEFVKLTNLSLTGTGGQVEIGNSVLPTGAGQVDYLQVSDFDFTKAWSLSGSITNIWTRANIPANSNLDVNFKLTNISPVPLPAGMALMLGGIGVFAAARLRKSATRS